MHRSIHPRAHHGHGAQDDHGDAHDLGLLHDLAVLRRRRALGWLAGAGTLALLGCGGGGDDAGSGTAAASSSSGSSSGSTSGATTCSVIPEETAGPYPGDGSNTANGSIANALALTGIVRSDIRASVAGASGTATGVPLTITIDLVDTGASCADLSGYAIYLWHCDAQGRYSMYSSGVTAENYLRGVQVTGSDGTVTFTTIVPGCYSGRMPHMHFEIYRSANSASSYSNKLRTSQIAFPADVMAAFYAAASGYGNSASNFASISFASDNVFSDGTALQMATMSGSVASGYSASLTVGIAA
jgi:protocatechuate 3,4-dioxygenase beta subunit